MVESFVKRIIVFFSCACTYVTSFFWLQVHIRCVCFVRVKGLKPVTLKARSLRRVLEVESV